MNNQKLLSIVLAISLVGNAGLAMGFMNSKSKADTAQASVMSISEKLTAQEAQLTDLTNKISAKEAETKTISDELDKLMAEKAKIEAEEKAKAEALAAEKAKAEAEAKAKADKAAADKAKQQAAKPASTSPSSSSSSKASDVDVNKIGYQKDWYTEPVGGWENCERVLRGINGGAFYRDKMGEWDERGGGWWATSHSGARGILTPNGSFFCGLFDERK